MAFGTIVTFEPLRSLAAASVLAGYSALGTPTTDHCRMLLLENLTDAQILISFDGINDNLILAVNSFKLFDFVSNEVTSDGFFLRKGTQIYAKRASGAASTGAVYASVIYATGGV